MHIIASTVIQPYSHVKKPINEPAPYRPPTGSTLPSNDTATLSSLGKSLAASSTSNIKDSSAETARQLAYGELHYLGPPTMSSDEINARLEVLHSYESKFGLGAFKQEKIDIFENGKAAGISFEEIIKQLQNHSEAFFDKLMNTA